MTITPDLAQAGAATSTRMPRSSTGPADPPTRDGSSHPTWRRAVTSTDGGTTWTTVGLAHGATAATSGEDGHALDAGTLDGTTARPCTSTDLG